MKKLLGVLGLSIAVLAGLLGYSVLQLNNADPAELTQEEVTPMITPIPPITETERKSDTVASLPAGEELVADNIVEEQEQQWDETELKELEEIEQDIVGNILTHDDYCYAYSRLNDSERQVYDEIYTAVVKYADKMPVSTTSPETLDKVFNSVMIDHPEIFYVNGYRYTKYTVGDVIKRMAFVANYTYSQKEADAISEDIDTIATGILMNVNPGASDYDKIKFIFDTIVLQTEYDVNSPDNQNVISVLINKRSVCQGYSKTMQLLLNRLGIPCTLCNGVVIGGERHAWNVVNADGNWYYLDVTWGDASYRLSDESDPGTEAIVPDVNYDYFLVPYSDLIKTHEVRTVIDMPNATSLDDNYYVHEGLYFTQFDDGQLRGVFDNAIANGQNYVALKCSDAGAYNEMYSQLVDNQRIFDYVAGKNIAYSYNPDTYKLLFALKR